MVEYHRDLLAPNLGSAAPKVYTAIGGKRAELKRFQNKWKFVVPSETGGLKTIWNLQYTGDYLRAGEPIDAETKFSFDGPP